MITDLLLPELQSRFADRKLRLGTAPNEVAIFPAAHPGVGDLTIWDDGDEATVGIGEITHDHFNPDDDSLSSEEIAKRVSKEVVEFLEDLFADRVLLWKSPDGRSGGWRVLTTPDDSLEQGNNLTYLWSGPVSALE